MCYNHMREEELEFILKNYQFMTHKDMAKALSRAHSTINRYMVLLGLKGKPRLHGRGKPFEKGHIVVYKNERTSIHTEFVVLQKKEKRND